VGATQALERLATLCAASAIQTRPRKWFGMPFFTSCTNYNKPVPTNPIKAHITSVSVAVGNEVLLSLAIEAHTSETGTSCQLLSHWQSAASQVSRCAAVSNENGKRIRSSRDGERIPTMKPKSSTSVQDDDGLLMVVEGLGANVSRVRGGWVGGWEGEEQRQEGGNRAVGTQQGGNCSRPLDVKARET
jgi:hypothetical protein